MSQFPHGEYHEWSEWIYNHNGGDETENYVRECVGNHHEGCHLLERVFVHLPKDGPLIDALTDLIEPVLSGQYGRDIARDVAIEALGLVQRHEKGKEK